MPAQRRQPGMVDIMDIPAYDNGNVHVSAGRTVLTVSAHRPEMVRQQRIVSSKVSISHAPSVNVSTRSPTHGMGKYVNKPLPPIPEAFPSGPTTRSRAGPKPVMNVNKPLPPHPAMNGVYTSTGQRLRSPAEVSAWSSTTASTRHERRRMLKSKAKVLNKVGDKFLELGDRYNEAHFGVPPPASRTTHNKRPAACVPVRNQSDAASERRLNAARQMMGLAALGQYFKPFERPEWLALTAREKAIVKHELETENLRKAKVQAQRMKKEGRCEIM